MCDEYGVSRITVKKAIDSLVQEGLVIKRRGSGTFVKDFDSYEDERNIPNKLLGFSEKHKDKNISTEILVFDIVEANEETVEKLKLKNTEFVYRIGRVRKIDKQPVCVEFSFIPINLVLGLSIVHVIDSIYSYVEKEMGIKIQSGHKEIFANYASHEISNELNVPLDSPILQINQVAYLETGQPFEFSHYYYPPKTFKYHTIDIR